MNWLLPRVLVTAIATILGGVIGGMLTNWSAPVFGALLGMAGALGVIAVRDTLRGYRLIEWLRGSQDGPAPRDAGLWGELGYRVERAIRSREHSAAQERERLSQFLSAIEASPNGVMLLDAGDQIEWCNSLAADIGALRDFQSCHDRFYQMSLTRSFQFRNIRQCDRGGNLRYRSRQHAS